MFQPTAQVIADSFNQNGDRLTTFVVKFHRFILAEWNTHRVHSKNTSSSRAIPATKMIDLLLEDDVFPLFWGKNQKGMVAHELLEQEYIDQAIGVWKSAREQAIIHANALIDLKAHKQIVNRLLEPFSACTVICTATDYQNFFSQRCHVDAQPEIRALAEAMKAAYDASEPVFLSVGKWHIPFICPEEKAGSANSTLIKISVGRCARVSYLNHDGRRNILDDIALHDRLLSSKPPHFSPFEHVAMALGTSEKRANFTGFESYRYQLERKNNE